MKAIYSLLLIFNLHTVCAQQWAQISDFPGTHRDDDGPDCARVPNRHDARGHAQSRRRRQKHGALLQVYLIHPDCNMVLLLPTMVKAMFLAVLISLGITKMDYGSITPL